MKNIFYKLGLVCLFAAGLTSCDEDRVTLNPDNGTNLWSFNESSSDLAINNNVQTDTIEVGVTSSSNVDRVIPVNVDPTSTATSNLYTIEPTSLVIPAGEFIGKIVVKGNFENVPDGQTFQLILTLDESQVQILDEKSFHIITIFKSCITESLAGTHSYSQYNIVTGDGAGNSTPVDLTTSGTVQWISTSVAGRYRTSDSSFGMYTAAYGDPAGQNATNPVSINWTCSGISTTGVDIYGDAVVYTVTSVNGPVLTLTWSSAYGDGGTVELTRAGGADWPDGLVTQ